MRCCRLVYNFLIFCRSRKAPLFRLCPPSTLVSSGVSHSRRQGNHGSDRCKAFLLLFTMQCMCVLHHNAPTLNTVLFGNKIKRLYFRHGVTVMASPADASPCVGSDDIQCQCVLVKGYPVSIICIPSLVRQQFKDESTLP